MQVCVSSAVLTNPIAQKQTDPMQEIPQRRKHIHVFQFQPFSGLIFHTFHSSLLILPLFLFSCRLDLNSFVSSCKLWCRASSCFLAFFFFTFKLKMLKPWCPMHNGIDAMSLLEFSDFLHVGLELVTIVILTAKRGLALPLMKSYISEFQTLQATKSTLFNGNSGRLKLKDRLKCST